MIIREIEAADAANFLMLCRQLDAETRMMMLEPGERTTTVEEQTRMIRGIVASPNSTILVAETGGKLVGHLSARGGLYRRNRHSVHIAVGIRRRHTGKGIGRALFTALEQWARAQGIRRLELTVMAHNEPARALYQKMGFEIEGRQRHALRVDGRYVDEYMMAKLLDD